MYDDEFELTFDMAEDNAETVKLPGKPLQPAPEAPEAPEPAGKAKEPEVPDFPDDEPTIVIPARKPREMPKQEWEPVRAEPVPELAPAEVKAPEEPAAAPEAPVPAIRTNGRTVLISGGDRGIGAATAKAFYEAGYRVAVFYHKNAEAAAALEKALPGCTIVQCDVASRASCELAFHAVEQALGRVDVLVSNAGIAQQKLFTDITPEEWQHMLDVNLTGAFNLCQLVLPGMIRRKAGRILTVSSMWGQTGGSCEVHYSAAKAGLIGLTKALAKEEGPSGITVNCVAPGVIDTDMMAAFTAEDKAALAEETPVGRLGSADEVAKLLLYLAGEDAGYITGQVFGVNGGLVI